MAYAVFAEERVVFHNLPWGTSMEEFMLRCGRPVYQEEYNGLQSLVYENVMVSGYKTYMLAYFSRYGLEGGTYYFLTYSIDELTQCYRDIQKELLDKYGPTLLCDWMLREMRTYETSWRFESGYVHLKVNTRLNDPVILWYSSPRLSGTMLDDAEAERR